MALRARLGNAARGAAYVAVVLPLGVLELVLVPAILLVFPAGVWRLASLERRLANALLHARIPALPEPRRDGIGWRPAVEEVTRGPARNVLALLVVRLPVAVTAAIAGAVPVALTVALVRYGGEGLSATSDRYVGPWALGPPVGVALLLLALPAAIVSVAVLDRVAERLRDLVRRCLVPASSGSGAVREALAESIGDRTLSIAYWLPDRSAFVDEHGLPIELPEPDSGRAWTAVEHEGRRVAAIIHDAELDARPELVRAAAAGAVLALDNERLKADLRARVEELRASRARIVQASVEARRKLERDLHDGAQQLLVALALDLQLIRSRVAADPSAVALVLGASEKLTSALAELRELARGIHPAILTDRGLAAALTALVDRTPLPVDTDVQLDDRLPPAAEAASYFVVAEALTNVVKYANATRVSVRVRRDPNRVVVEVEDDGVGGADIAAGSGLRGLGDRVAAIDGTLTLHSPPGQGTRVVAHIAVPRAS